MPITCVKKIAANIADDCTTPAVGGAENVVTLINIADYQAASITRSSTNPMVIEGIVLPSTKVGYTLEFVPDSIGATVKKTAYGTYDHAITGMLNVSNNNVKQTLNDMDGGRYVAIVKLRNPNAEIKYQIFGESSGLTLPTWDQDVNANNGCVSFTMATSESSKEPRASISLFKTDLTTTAAIVAALLVAVP